MKLKGNSEEIKQLLSILIDNAIKHTKKNGQVIVSLNKNKNNIHYPKKKIKEKQSAYQKLTARLEYLEAENEFLKKLQSLIQSQK